jgi:hypothetical protein
MSIRPLLKLLKNDQLLGESILAARIFMVLNVSAVDLNFAGDKRLADNANDLQRRQQRRLCVLAAERNHAVSFAVDGNAFPALV